ncbi:MAG: hypothetical protein VXY93_18160, partial [Pseudomonadota bacterium]|nr:hypothetical protein [Pseudomonadota bacterium]
MAGYVSGFVAATSRTVEWKVPANAPATLYYWCHHHTGQGNSFSLSDGAYLELNNKDKFGVTGLGTEVYNIGILTATSADITGDLDVNGHTNLDNLSIAGVTTFSSNIDVNGNGDISGNLVVGGTINSGDNITITKGIPTLHFVDTNANDFQIRVNNNLFTIRDTTNGSANRFMIDASGNVTINEKLFVVGDLDVDGHT